MKNLFKLFGIIALAAVIGFSFATCGGDDSGGDGGDENKNDNSNANNEYWRTSKYKTYTVKDGVANLAGEGVYNYITDRYTSDTNNERKYTITYTSYDTTTTSSVATYHDTRNGQTNVSTYESATETRTNIYTYDSESGLQLEQSYTSTSNSGGTTTTTSFEVTYNIVLLSDADGVKTYKVSYKTYTYNGNSQDVSARNYQECKIQNGRTLEQKTFGADGNLQSTDTNTYPDNAVIRAKLPYFMLNSYSSSKQTQTVELLSDSETELVIRVNGFWNNVLLQYYDYTYEKASRSK